jgi:hypothetical protein
MGWFELRGPRGDVATIRTLPLTLPLLQFAIGACVSAPEPVTAADVRLGLWDCRNTCFCSALWSSFRSLKVELTKM